MVVNEDNETIDLKILIEGEDDDEDQEDFYDYEKEWTINETDKILELYFNADNILYIKIKQPDMKQTIMIKLDTLDNSHTIEKITQQYIDKSLFKHGYKYKKKADILEKFIQT